MLKKTKEINYSIRKELRKRQEQANSSVGNIDITKIDVGENIPNEYPTETETTDPEELGWLFYTYDEERGEAYKSIIMNKTGNPSEIWFVEENNKDKPNRFPAGWKSNQLIYHDKTIIESSVMIDELLENQVPNNWIITLDKIREGDIGKPLHLKHPDSYSPPYAPDSYSPPYAPDSSHTHPELLQMLLILLPMLPLALHIILTPYLEMEMILDHQVLIIHHQVILALILPILLLHQVAEY